MEQIRPERGRPQWVVIDEVLQFVAPIHFVLCAIAEAKPHDVVSDISGICHFYHRTTPEERDLLERLALALGDAGGGPYGVF